MQPISKTVENITAHNTIDIKFTLGLYLNSKMANSKQHIIQRKCFDKNQPTKFQHDEGSDESNRS